jgi:SAM-dependent methyltransferase
MSHLPEKVVMEDRACPNGCAKDDRPVMEAGDRLHHIPGRFFMVQCGRCRLLRTNPRPTPATIGAYYPTDYAPYSSPTATVGAKATGLKRRIRQLLALETRSTPPVPPGKLLEIGCASGAYLESMRAAGWKVEGIEFSEAASARAREKGLDVRTGTVESAEPPIEPVDLVAAWMVLEHLHEPVNALKKIRSWVTPSAYLIASIPDASALERRIFGDRWYALQMPTHLYHYTPETIRDVLRNAGWELKKVTWQRNCNNLLKSLECLLEDLSYRRLLYSVQWLRTSTKAKHIRVFLAWILGVSHQSGRIEIWAQPIKTQNTFKS